MKTCHPRCTRTQWPELVEQQSQSGQPIRAFCEENDIGLASFGKWKRKLGKSPSTKNEPLAGPMFQPVSVEGRDLPDSCRLPIQGSIDEPM